MTDLGMGLNRQREFVTLVREIAAGSARTPGSVLDDPKIREVLDGPEPDRNRRAAGLRRVLYAMRFPHLARAEADFRDKVRALRLPPRVRWTPPPYFEGRDHELKLRFKDKKELIEIKEVIDRIISDPRLDTLF